LQIERATQRLVQGYFSVSQSVVDAYIRELRYPAKKMTVIANGLIPDPIIKAQPLSRAELGAAEGVPLVLMVGKFFAQKGHRYLIEAWPAVQRAFPTARLLLAGGGPLEGEIRVQVKKRGFEGQIQFLGVRSDIPRLLKTADVFVFPTLFEGMSNALLEAMLAGCAIVTTDIPENREIVTDDEVLFVPPANSEKLAEALVALLNDQARQKRMGACAKQRVQRDFLIDRTIATLDAAYQKALAA
jgi:glycosyltransferase involved in cell wall biosynthesis